MNGQRGFTLLEAVIAFAMLAVSGVVVVDVVGQQLARQAVLEARRDAADLASSLLDEHSVQPPYAERDLAGTQADYRWKVAIRPQRADTRRPASTVYAVDVTVRVEWGSSARPHAVEARRLAFARPPA